MSSELVQTVAGIRVVQRFQLACSVLMLYDHLITLDQEIEFIWRKKWSCSKAFFLLNRYIGLLVAFMGATWPVGSYVSCNVLRSSISTQCDGGGRRCQVFLRLQGVLNAILFTVAGAVLSLRVMAMMTGSRITMVVIFTLLAIDCVVMIMVLVICTRLVGVLPNRDHLSICIPTGVPRYFWTFYIAPLVFETVLFGLALGASIHHLRQKCLWDSKMVISVLIRDSVFYFMVAEIVYVANAATAFYIAHHGIHHSGYIYVPWLQIPQGASIVTTCIIVSRLILNLQDVYYLPVDTSAVMSSLRWKEPSDVDIRVEDCDVVDIVSDRPSDEVLDISDPNAFDTREILEIHRPRPVSVA